MNKLFVVVGLCLLVACETEEFGVGLNSITVRNEDGAAREVLIADSSTCFAGIRSTVQNKTTRMFDVSDEAFICLNGGGVKTTPGSTYVIKGGALTME